MRIANNLTLYLGGFVAVGVAAGGVALLAQARSHAEQHEGRERQAEVAAGPHVVVIAASSGPIERRIELQGEARPFAEVTLYAKISGYLKAIAVDKGDSVKEGQLLAVLESPELDRQYDAAVADAKFKRDSAGRTASLAKSGFVAPRDAELDTSQATMSAANVALLASQKGYTQLRAPFAGTITARFADPGALLQSAVNAQTSAMPVVTISQLDRLRVYAYVDQRDAAAVHPGDPAEVSLPGAVTPPQRGSVTRIAAELDSRTRTMLIEVDLDNRERQIVAGSFVAVALTLKIEPAVEIPVEALVMRGKETLAAQVDAQQRVHFVPIALLSNDGVRLRLRSGLAVGDRVALNLGDSLPEAGLIRPLSSPPTTSRK